MTTWSCYAHAAICIDLILHKFSLFAALSPGYRGLPQGIQDGRLVSTRHWSRLLQDEERPLRGCSEAYHLDAHPCGSQPGHVPTQPCRYQGDPTGDCCSHGEGMFVPQRRGDLMTRDMPQQVCFYTSEADVCAVRVPWNRNPHPLICRPVWIYFSIQESKNLVRIPWRALAHTSIIIIRSKRFACVLFCSALIVLKKMFLKNDCSFNFA